MGYVVIITLQQIVWYEAEFPSLNSDMKDNFILTIKTENNTKTPESSMIIIHNIHMDCKRRTYILTIQIHDNNATQDAIWDDNSVIHDNNRKCDYHVTCLQQTHNKGIRISILVKLSLTNSSVTNCLCT
jgi:hypothetical protein